MKIYDISVRIRPDMPTWPGDPPVSLEKISSLENGDDANISLLKMCVHTGTHIDAPNHFLKNGKTIEDLSMDAFIGQALVMEIEPKAEVITEPLLKSHPDFHLLQKSKRVLFKTRNSELWHTHPDAFQPDYVGIDSSGAMLLARLNLLLIGVDYLSIANYTETNLPHQVLLSQGIVLLEGIDLSSVPSGSYHLICLPLKIADCEGAPARTILYR